MKYFICILLVLLVASCDNGTKTVSDSSLSDKTKAESSTTDSVMTFSFVTNFSHPNITNKSDRQIDMLFNGIDNYLGGQSNPNVRFHTECMRCEPIQEYMGGLLFAKRLLISNDKITYFKTGFEIPDSLNRIELISDDGERTNTKFEFTDGKGSIRYIGISCIDADFNKVSLLYTTGEVIIDSLINASFFEYDSDADGQKEQYLFGTRNCSQEFVILRIRKPKDKK